MVTGQAAREGEGCGLQERLQPEPGALRGRGPAGRPGRWGWGPGRRRGGPEKARFRPRRRRRWAGAGKAQHPGSGAAPGGHGQPEPGGPLSTLSARVTPALGPSPSDPGFTPEAVPGAASPWGAASAGTAAGAQVRHLRPSGPRAGRLGGAKSSMAAPARKARGTGALQPRAQKGRVRRAVRISSLVAQEVGDSRPLPLPSRAGTPVQDAAQRSLADSGSRPDRASERQDGLGNQRVGSPAHPAPGSNWLLPRPTGAGRPAPFWPGLPSPRAPVVHGLLAQLAKGGEGQERTRCPERMAGDRGRRGTCFPATTPPPVGIGQAWAGPWAPPLRFFMSWGWACGGCLRGPGFRAGVRGQWGQLI